MAQCVQCETKLLPNAQFCASCGAQVTVHEPEGDPYVGRVFAQKYRVEQLLGEGGMGRVYRAVQLSLDKIVCLKVLRRELAADPATQARFQREARAASRLNHPNSIQVMDFGAAEGGELYLAMEYIAGRDLQQLLAAEFPLAESRVCHLMAQVLDALAEAHAQHVIHRDLKPENIMVCEHRGDPNYVKVLDFGIAKIQDNDTQPKLTRAGLVCGTPEYMSPEQARGLELDARSDLYSAGVILYQLTAGCLPFNADSPIGFVTAHLNEKPLPPSQRRPGISPAMQSLILRTLSKNRDDRPPSAKAMWSELLAIEKGEEPEPATEIRGSGRLFGDGAVTDVVKASPGSLRPRAQPAPRRSRLGLALGAVAVTVVLAGAAVAALRFTPREAGVAEVPPPAGLSAESLADAKKAYAEGKDLFQQGIALMSETEKERRDELLHDAERKYYHAYKVNPNDPAPLYGLGNVYNALGDTTGAIRELTKYVQSDPRPPDADKVQRMLDRMKSNEAQK